MDESIVTLYHKERTVWYFPPWKSHKALFCAPAVEMEGDVPGLLFRRCLQQPLDKSSMTADTMIEIAFSLFWPQPTITGNL